MFSRLQYKQLQDSGVIVPTNFQANQVPSYSYKGNEALHAYRDWVFACVRKNSLSFSDLELTLYKGNRKSFREIESHESLDLLYNANSVMDYNLLLQLLQIYFDLVGENFIWTAPNSRGIPTTLIPLRPDLVTIHPSKDKTKLIDYYGYRIGGEELKFEPETILAFNNPNPLDPLRGVGVVRAAALAIDTNTYASEYNRNFFKNSAVPLGAFVTEKRLTDRTKKRLEASIKEKNGGVKNAHKPVILEQSLKWEAMGIPQKDMEFLNQRKFSRDEIFTMFDVPKDLMNTEDSNRASVKEAINIYMKFGIKPRMKNFVSMLNEFYLPLWGENLFFDFKDPSPIDVETNQKIAQSAKLTVNENRELFGYPPVEDGDVMIEEQQTETIEPNGTKTIITKTVQIPVNVNRKKKFNASIRPQNVIEEKIETWKEKQLSEARQELDIIKRKKIVRLRRKTAEAEEESRKDRDLIFTKEQKNMIWKLFDDSTSDYTKSYLVRLRQYIHGQERRILEQLQSKQMAKGISDINFNVPREKTIFVAKFREFIEDLVRTQGKDILSFLGLGSATFDMSSPEIINFINTRSFNKVNGINELTKERLRKILEQSIRDGEGIPQISTRIKDYYAQYSKKRALRIAQTEVIKAHNFATMQGYKQSGVVKGKEWLSSRDGRVRESHRPFTGVDGQKRKLNEKFSNGCSAPGYGGPAKEVVNCRCTIIPVLTEDVKIKVPNHFQIDLDTKEEDLLPKKVKEAAENIAPK